MSCQLSLDQVLQAVGGVALSSTQDSFVGVGTDTRQSLEGKLFVALKGDNFDAHKFIKKAVEQGAKGLVVHSQSAEVEQALGDDLAQVSVIQVKDTLQALQDLAHFWRKTFKAQVVGISGSNGKTTTKEFVAAISETKFKTLASRGSFNNHWGVPISLLEVSMDDEVAVIEMGMNHEGELTRLCEIAEPNIVLVTNVGKAHVGELGSIEAVARAKEELYRASPGAIQVFNLDNANTIPMYERAQGHVEVDKLFSFSSYRPGVSVSLRAQEMSLASLKVSGQIDGVEGMVDVPVFGRHNVSNIMAASCVALALGMSSDEIWRALPNCRTTWGRSQLVKLKNGAHVLFDAYNANPESMAAMVKNLLEIAAAGEKIVVVGEMLELGSEADKLHSELGEMLGNTDVGTIWFIGPSHGAFEAGLKRSGFEKNFFFSSTYEETLANKLGSMIHQPDIAVIKGSRGMKLEQVLKAWEPVDF